MIITVDPELSFHERVEHALEGSRWAPALTHASTVTEAVALLRQAGQVRAVIGGTNLSLEDGLLLTEHAVSGRSGTAVLLIGEPSTDVLRRAMRAGARDVLAPSFDEAELLSALTEAGVADDGPAPLPGVTVAVLGVKGGVGSSVLASNLTLRLADATSQPVTLADLDLASADLAVMHGVNARWTIQDVADGTVGLDIESVRDVLHRIADSTARLLPGPLDPALAERITPTDVTNVVAMLRAEAPLVVLDLATSFDDRTLAALDAADLVVLTSGLDVASLRGLAVTLRTLDRLGIEDDRIRIALVRADSKAGLTVADVERTIGRPVDIRIPSTRAVPRSVNEGVPLAISSTRSGVVQAVDELVDDIVAGMPPLTAPAGGESRDEATGLRRLFQRGGDGSNDESPAPRPSRARGAASNGSTDDVSEEPMSTEPTKGSTATPPRVVRRVVETRRDVPRDATDEVLFLGDEEPLPPPVPIDSRRRIQTEDGSGGLSAMPPPVLSDDDNDSDGHGGGRRLGRR